jgi:hypothetical protein
MTKLSEKLTAYESVWVYRLRQRIALERIILTVGNSKEQHQAKKFLEAMEQANPELFEDIELCIPELLDDNEPGTLELFDEREYSQARGRKVALKLPRDIRWEDRVIRRAAREYRELFHPCENLFKNAMKGLQYLNNLHPELFARAKALAIEQRDQILTFEIYCKCNCTPHEDLQPAETFRITDRGRFKNASRRIAHARQVLAGPGDSRQGNWQFFLDRIGEVAPEMLES